MSVSLNMESFSNALKVVYSKEAIANLVNQKNPFLAMVAKDTKSKGKSFQFDVTYSLGGGRSADFATAKANQSSDSLIAFTVTRVKDYAMATIDNETLMSSQGDEAALVEAGKYAIDKALQHLTMSLAKSLYGSGSGTIGKIASFTGAVITLSNRADSKNFFKGLVLKTSTADGTGSVKAGKLTVAAVDRKLGKITCTADINAGIATVANNDFISVEGDYGKKAKGLAAWLPTTAPSPGENFFGVDRSVDTRLSGVVYDGQSDAINDALYEGASRIADEGGMVDTCLVSFSKYAELQKALQGKVQYLDHKVGEIGFEAIVIAGPNSKIKVIPDQNCPEDKAYLLQLDTWTLKSVGDAPMIVDLDGNKMLREPDADALRINCAYYAQLVCSAPGWNGVVILD